MCPIRSAGVLLVAADQATVPPPVPLAPEEMESHEASLTAVREQLETFAVIVIVPVLLVELMFCELGFATKLQAAFWFTVKLLPPIVIVPVRAAAAGFASYVYPILAEPEPEVVCT